MTKLAAATVFVSIIAVSMLTIARAEDVGAIVAALKDEASECRYFMQRCELARAAKRQVSATLDSVQASISSGAVRGNAAAADDLQAQMRGAIAAAGKYNDDAETVHNVIAAKHDRAPACLTQCPDVLNP